MKMAHQSQLENRNYRNWVKAGLGLKYTKEGLEPFCDQLVKQQHVDILNKVKQKHNLTTVTCGLCDTNTLQPDHVRTRSRQCLLGQINCNCQHPGGKIVCPNNVCGAIYDKIIQLHASTPPRPFWKNTYAKHWCTEPWALANSFINNAGYETKLKASDVDCPGLIHVLINNMDFRDHLSCTTDRSELLQKVLQYRNNIYHSHDMELEDKDVIIYIDAMIALLQDGKELINMEESKSAVSKLRELKSDDFVITTTSEAEIRRAVMTDMKHFTEEAEKRKHELEKTGQAVRDEVATIGTRHKTALEHKGKEVSDQITYVGSKQKTDLEQKGKEVIDQVASIGTEQKTDLEQKGKEVGDQVASIGTKHKTDLEMEVKEVSDQVASIGTKQKTDLEQKGKEVGDQVASIGTKQKTDLELKGKEVGDQVASIGTKQKTDLELKGKEVGDEIASIGTKQKTDLEQKGKEVGDQVASIGTKLKTDLELEGKEVSDQVTSIGTKQKTDLDHKGKEVGDQVASIGTKQKTDLELKGKEVGDEIASIGTKQKTDLEQKGKEVGDQVASIGTKHKTDLELKGKEVSDQVASIGSEQKTDLEQKGKEVGDQVASIGTKQKTDLELKGKEVGDEIASIGTKQKTDLEQKGEEVGDEIASIGTKQKTNLEQKGKEVGDQVASIGTKQKTDLELKGKEVGDEITSIGTKQKTDLELKGKEVSDQVASIGTKQKTDLEQKGKEVIDQVASIGTEQKTDLEQKGKEVGDQVASIGTKHKTDLEMEVKEVSDQVASIGTKQKTDLEQKGKEVGDQVASIGTKQKTDLELKGKEVGDQVASIGTKQKTDLELKGKEVGDDIASIGTKQKTDLEQKGKEVGDQVASIGTKLKTDLELEGKEVSDQVTSIGTKQKTDLDHKGKEVGDQVASIGTKQKTDLELKGKEVGDEIASIGTKQKTDLEQKGKEVGDQVASIGTKHKTDLELKGKEVSDQVASIGSEQKTDLEQKGKEVGDQVASIGTKQKTDLELKGKEVGDEIASIGTKQKTDLEQKGEEVGDEIASIGTKQKTNLEQKGKEVGDQVASIGTKQKTDLELKGKEVGDEITSIGTKQKTDLELKGKEVSDQVASIGTKQKTDLEHKELEVIENIKKEETKIKTELEQKQKESIDELVEKTKLNIELAQKVKGYPTKEHNPDYNSKKAEYQKKLVDDYIKYAMHVSALPLRPESNQTDIENVYVSPWIAVDVWDENSRQTKEEPISMDEMFHHEEKPAKNIYVLGEAGSGKTTLCKMLVYYWCVAHSQRKANTFESAQCSAVKVMLNYDFLFHVSLRHYTDLNKIEIMLDEIYPDPLLRTILQNESDKCLILLDGLDEWTAQNQRTSQFLTSGLPTRDLHAKYTIITTSRRWKFDTLRIKESEIDKKIKLKGIRGTAVTELTETTLRTLNKTFHIDKVADDFLPALKTSPVADVSHVPMILQQLICLWFDDKLRGNSKCAIYSSLLDLFFDWNALKLLSKQKIMVPLENENFPGLPACLNESMACLDNTNAIYHLSHLAYKTLFGRHKENTLTFSNSNFQQLNIPGDVIACCLKVGILSEDQNINLFASRRQRTSFSFVHKSMQEFLAAVYVSIQFETMIQSLDDLQKSSDVWSDNCKQFVYDHFGDCKTVADILEQSNIFIMLCGVESQLLPFISEYIYTITTVDKQITEERKIAKDDFCGHRRVLQNDIQKCIVSCVSEALSSGNQFKNSVYIADIVLDGTKDVHVVSYLHRQIFNLHRVLSVALPYRSSNQDIENVFSVLKLVTECDSLKTFKYSGHTVSSSTLPEAAGTCIDRIEQQTVEIFARNKSTLETVTLIAASERPVKHLVQIIPTMCHLISFRVSLVTVSHEVCRSLCTVLEQSVHLQQLQLNITCKNYDKLSINFTKHKQLQYLNLSIDSICASSVNTESLDTCRLKVETSHVVCESLYNARRLKHLALQGGDTTRYKVSVARRVTDCLVRLLPSLTSLSTVVLWNFTFTDNIFTRPSDMRNLQEIKLLTVTMSMATWCAFVDSLLALPQTVNVGTLNMQIENIDSALIRPYKAVHVPEAAQQYIRRKPESFLVTKDKSILFAFVTKKAGL